MTPAQFPSLHSFPVGSRVSLRWASLDGPVEFYVYAASAMVPGCTQNATSGACSFVAGSQSYLFNYDPLDPDYTVFQVDYHGSAATPLV